MIDYVLISFLWGAETDLEKGSFKDREEPSGHINAYLKVPEVLVKGLIRLLLAL